MAHIEYMHADMDHTEGFKSESYEGKPSTSIDNQLRWLNWLGEVGWIPVGKPEIHNFYKGYECLFYRNKP